MKLPYQLFVLLVAGSLVACTTNDNNGPQQTSKYLSHPAKAEIDLLGSIMLVDGGIMVLVQNGPLKAIPTILIPTNDSAKTMLMEAYNKRLDDSYQISQIPWVKVAGNFIREDSLSPIFKYSWVEFLDYEKELNEIEEMSQ
jgi:hypothetical protein